MKKDNTFEGVLAKIFRLNDKNWLKHANPWSVYTRYTVLPIIILAGWSRVWINQWWPLALGIAIIWAFVNPIIFPKPKSFNSWASKAVFGERFYLQRKTMELPDIHKTRLYGLLKFISFIGFLISVYATVNLLWIEAIFGVFITYLSKSWFLDRMVWLYEDMKNVADEF